MSDTKRNVAFAHDDSGGGEISSSTKPGRLSKLTQNTPGLIATITIVLILLFMYLINRDLISAWVHKDRSSSKTTQSQPSQGTLTLTDSEWRGVIVEGNKRVRTKILTDDVYWQVRLDKDDSRVYDLAPRNYGRKTVLTFPDGIGANVQEWRIKPGQDIREGTLLYVIYTKGEVCSF